MELQRATIRRFDAVLWQADLELAGAPGALLAGVPVAATIGPELLAPGSRVWAVLATPGSPADGLVLAPYGAPPAPWVTSRLWKPALATAGLAGPQACTSPSFADVPGLQLALSLEVTSTVLLLLAASGTVAAGAAYSLAFYHDDGHESTQLAPVAAVSCTPWALAWLATQTTVAPGTHTFTLMHRASGGEAVMEVAKVVAVAASA